MARFRNQLQRFRQQRETEQVQHRQRCEHRHEELVRRIAEVAAQEHPVLVAKTVVRFRVQVIEVVPTARERTFRVDEGFGVPSVAESICN